jgi:hypothetical protein
MVTQNCGILELSLNYRNVYREIIEKFDILTFMEVTFISHSDGRVRTQVRSCEVCGGQSGTKADFLLVLQFHLLILNLPTAPHSSSIIRGWYNEQNSGRRTK